jgi:hypothetical protein
MEGGGACFGVGTCLLSDTLLAATHRNKDDFNDWVAKRGSLALVNRDRAENPFKDWNFVYMPYCSGDVFAGNNEHGFEGRTQVGFENVKAYLPKLQSTFKDTDQLVLSGSSAGGYGAAWDYVQVQTAFDWVDITMLDDSGPPFSSKFTAPCLQERWNSAWAMDTVSPVPAPFPLGTGKPGLGSMVSQIFAAHPKSKFAFVSHADDLVMRLFHGIGQSFDCAMFNLLPSDFFADGLREIRTIDAPNFSTFYGPGTTHMYFTTDDGMYNTTVDDIALTGWLTKLVTTRDEQRRVPANF